MSKFNNTTELRRSPSPDDFERVDMPDAHEIAQYESGGFAFIPRMSTLDKEHAKKKADELGAVVDDALGKTKEALHEIVDAAKAADADNFEVIHNEKDSAGGILDASKQLVSDAFEATKTATDNVAAKTVELDNAAFDKTDAAVTATTEKIGDLYEGAKQAATNAVDQISGFGSAAAEKVSEVSHSVYDATAEAAHDAVETVSNVATATKDTLISAPDAAKETANDAIEAVYEKAHGAGDILSDATEYVKSAAASSADYVTSTANDAVTVAKDAGSNVSDVSHEVKETASENLPDFKDHAIDNVEHSPVHTAHALDDLPTNEKTDLSKPEETVAEKVSDFVNVTTDAVEHGIDNAKHSAANTADALNQLATEFQGYVNTEINTDHIESPIQRSPSPPAFPEQELVTSAPIQAVSPQPSARQNDESTGHSPAPSPPNAPVINDEPDDIIDNVQETLPEPINVKLDEASRKDIEEHVDHAVQNTTDEVDDIINNLGRRHEEEPQVPEHNSPSGDSGRDTLGGLLDDIIPKYGIPNSDSLTGLRDVSPDVETYSRDGPLTIPYGYQQQASAPVEHEVQDEPELPSGFDSLPARPPTPPKDITDEAVQPPAIDLGPPSHSHEKPTSSGSGILKHYSDVAPWFDFKTVDPNVLDVVYWRDPKKSGAVLGAILIALLLVSKFSLLSLVAYLSLAALVGTIGFRVYNIILARLNKSDGANPFTPYLAHDLDVPQEKVHAQVDVLLENGKAAAEHLKKLFLVEKLCDSVKFGLLLWTLTYIGAWFSGLGLVTLFVIGVFSIPKIYEIYQEPIDANLAVVKEQLEKVNAIVAEKAPFLACGNAAPAKKEE